MLYLLGWCAEVQEPATEGAPILPSNKQLAWPLNQGAPSTSTDILMAVDRVARAPAQT